MLPLRHLYRLLKLLRLRQLRQTRRNLLGMPVISLSMLYWLAALAVALFSAVVGVGVAYLAAPAKVRWQNKIAAGLGLLVFGLGIQILFDRFLKGHIDEVLFPALITYSTFFTLVLASRALWDGFSKRE